MDFDLDIARVQNEEIQKYLAKKYPRLYGPKTVIVEGQYVTYVEYGTGPAPAGKKADDKTGRILFRRGIPPKRFVTKSVGKINGRIQKGEMMDHTVLDIANELSAEIQRQYKLALEDSNAKITVRIEERN